MRQDPAVRWLLASDDPSVRYLTMVDLLDEPLSFDEVREVRQRLPEGPRVKALLAGQQADGGFGVGPYQKWRGAHWRLISLVELGVDGGDPRAVAAAHQVLDWLCGDSHRRRIWKIGGLTRAHASQEGNALAVFSRLGMAGEPRVAAMADSLVEWQWPDGGWNCSGKEDARHSSFYESLAPLWGLVEYQRAVGGQRYAGAVDRASELFLRHRLFRSERTGEVINPEWLKLHYPLYWRYDVLQALLVLDRAGKLGDPRAREALDHIKAKRLPDGRWRSGGSYWRRPGSKGSNVEVVDWGRRKPSEMITLNALRVLKAAGRTGC